MAVSSDSWKEASIHSIKLAQAVIGQSDRGVEQSSATDPLPLIREACVRESNERIHAYARSTRSVVARLRKSLAATNEEIKALNRGKEALERALEHKRKDLALNSHCLEIRTYRPSREKDTDCADRLLAAETSQLLTLKMSLESQLRKVKQQLQALNAARSRLSCVIQERSRVTDLLCNSVHTHATVPTPIFSHALTTSRQRASSKRSKCHSAPAPLGVAAISSRGSSGGVTSRSTRGSGGADSRGSDLMVSGRAALEEEQGISSDPYSSMTPDALQSMTLASDARGKSQGIRQELHKAIEQTQRLQQASHDTVNEGLTRKLAQTVTLTQHLQVNAGETRVSSNRAQRYYNSQERAQGYILGPVSSSDVTTREKLDRPLVRVYQRHPDTNLPDAGHLAEANALYCDSMETARRNMTLLKLAERRLQVDIKDKDMAAGVDSNVVRLRRRRANHRWLLERPATT